MSLHHATVIVSDAQAAVDFYSGFLGLRLVKRTAGAADPRQLHLFFGDGHGSPGTLVTCLVWENAGRGRAGAGAFGEIALAAPREALGYWIGRCLDHGVAHEGPVREFGEPVLRLKDPDGLIVKIAGTEAPPAPAPWSGAPTPAGLALRGLRSATLLSAAPSLSLAFLRDRFGVTHTATEGAVSRLAAPDGRAVDVRDGAGFWTAAPGAGTIDHVALRTASASDLATTGRMLADNGAEVSETKDRRYFVSLYLREPGGALVEVATDGPGMAVDEPLDSLGERLIVPEEHAPIAEDLRIMLPQVVPPDEPSARKRDLPFLHAVRRPEAATGETLLLLHGTGGGETDLLPLGARIAPEATLIGLRGRSVEEGVNRWFRRLSMKSFDQDDVRAEAAALAEFARQAAPGYGLDPEGITWLGYSNGANMIGALALLHPEVVRRAILFRAMPVLDPAPAADLSGREFLILNGANDPYDDRGALADLLRRSGAVVDTRRRPVGHGFDKADEAEAAAWYARRRGPPAEHRVD